MRCASIRSFHNFHCPPLLNCTTNVEFYISKMGCLGLQANLPGWGKLLERLAQPLSLHKSPGAHCLRCRLQIKTQSAHSALRAQSFWDAGKHGEPTPSQCMPHNQNSLQGKQMLKKQNDSAAAEPFILSLVIAAKLQIMAVSPEI